MKSFRNIHISIRWQTISIAVILSIFVEISPVISDKYEKLNRIIYAIIAVIISVLIENAINKRKFVNGIKEFITALIGLRIKYFLSPEAIQEIMKLITKQLSIVLEQSRVLNNHSYKSIDNAGKLSCRICSKDHLTDEYAKCQICKLKSNLWESVNS
jgi:hypothetical protein